MNILSHQTFSSLITKTCVAAALLLLPVISQAFFMANPVDLNGWAWSENIGWIALDGPTHQVTINTNGTVTGWAWSENIGWIKFGGLSNFPTSGGTSQQNARLQPISGSDNYQIQGWARACAGTVDGDCNSASRTDGWDGWISLSGTATNGSPYAVQLSPSGPVSNSFAWGSTVVGWIDMFSHVTFDSVPNAIISVTPCTVQLGSIECTEQLSYTFANIDVLTDSPEIKRTNPNPTTIADGEVSDNISTPLRIGSNAYRAEVNGGNVVGNTSVNVYCVANASLQDVGGNDECACNDTYSDDGSGNCVSTGGPAAPTPQIDITATNGRTFIRQGDTVEFKIEVAGASPVCTIAGPGVTASDNPIFNSTGPLDGVSTTYLTKPINNFSRFTITCQGMVPGDPSTSGYVMSENITVRVVPSVREQ